MQDKPTTLGPLGRVARIIISVFGSKDSSFQTMNVKLPCSDQRTRRVRTAEYVKERRKGDEKEYMGRRGEEGRRES